MFDKENRENVKKMNLILNTQHRTRPYDMNNTVDLEEALLLAIAAYRDYWYYTITLNELFENFDESIEHYDPASWLNMPQNPKKADDLITGCADSLDVTAGMFDILADRSKEHCATIIKAVLSAPKEAQKAVFGRIYKIEPHEIDAKIEELFDSLAEVEYHHNMQKNRDALLEVMEEQWPAIE